MTDKDKLEKLKKLADAMYYAAQYLTTDASRLHKAMDEYRKFIINEYHKEEPTIPDIVDEHFHEMLGEEPVSEDLEEVSKNYALNNTPWDDCKDEIQEAFKAGAKWQKTKDESTTEDLGEYINELSKQFPEVSFAKLSRIAVRVAKWQKQQDQSTIELAEDHAMLAGMNKMEQQMMAKAVDGIARPYDNEIWCILDSFSLKDGDEVKVIVIKKK